MYYRFSALAVCLLSPLVVQAQNSPCVVITGDYQVCENLTYVNACQAACFQGSCRFNQTDYHLPGADNQPGAQTRHNTSAPANQGQAGVEVDDSDIVEFECVIGGQCTCIPVDGVMMCRRGNNDEPMATDSKYTQNPCVGANNNNP